MAPVIILFVHVTDFDICSDNGNSDQPDGNSTSEDAEDYSETELETEQESSDESDEIITTAEDLIHESSEISVNTFNHMFLGVSEKHGLSEYAKEDLLKLFSMSLPDDNKIPKSVYFYKKSMEHLYYDIKDYTVCTFCKEEVANNMICHNANCDSFQEQTKSFQFTIIDILPQLKRIISGLSQDLLLKRFLS